jgi:hypothetical protein
MFPAGIGGGFAIVEPLLKEITMSIEDPANLPDIDHEIRINELRHEAEELAGGPMTFHESEDCPPEIAEQFMQSVVNMERAGWTTHHDQLKEDGIVMPPDADLDDAQLHAKLWEIIHGLAERRVFISNTNHLSDRELYKYLREDVFHETVVNMRFPPHGAYHIDILSSGSDEDTWLHFKYFADAQYRRRWMEQFPDYDMPPHEDPPYDRDRLLPQCTYGPPPEDPEYYRDLYGPFEDEEENDEPSV